MNFEKKSTTLSRVILQVWMRFDDPPNANLSILGNTERATNIVVEIMTPRFKDGYITYDLRVLDGEPPAEGGLAALFVDYWVGPRLAVCHGNY